MDLLLVLLLVVLLFLLLGILLGSIFGGGQYAPCLCGLYIGNWLSRARIGTAPSRLGGGGNMQMDGSISLRHGLG